MKAKLIESHKALCAAAVYLVFILSYSFHPFNYLPIHFARADAMKAKLIESHKALRAADVAAAGVADAASLPQGDGGVTIKYNFLTSDEVQVLYAVIRCVENVREYHQVRLMHSSFLCFLCCVISLVLRRSASALCRHSIGAFMIFFLAIAAVYAKL
jgi:hypothetical protein